MLFLSALAAFVAATDYTMCFYESESDNCPKGSLQYKLSKFSDFTNHKIDDGVHFTFVILDDMVDSRGRRLVLTFDQLKNKDPTQLISVEIKCSGDPRECTIDLSAGVYTNIVGKLTLNNLELYTKTENPSFVFTNVEFKDTTFTDTSDYVLEAKESIISDPLTLDCFSSYKTPILQLVPTSWPSANPVRKLDSSVLQKVQVKVDNVAVSVHLVGDRVRISDYAAMEDSSITLDLEGADIDKTIFNFEISGSSGFVNVSCLAFGISHRLPVINGILSNNGHLQFEESTFPTLTHKYFVVSGSGRVTLAPGLVPVEIDATSGELTVNSNYNTHIIGLKASSQTMNIQGSGNLWIDLVSTDASTGITATGVAISIGSVSLKGDLNIAGDAAVDFGAMGETTDYKINVPTLKMNSTTIAFTLAGAATVSGNKVELNDNQVIELQYTGAAITQAEIDQYKSTQVKLICGEGVTDKVSVKFPVTGEKGITSTTSLYDAPKVVDKCLVIELNQNAALDQVNDKFCIAENEADCSAGYQYITDVNGYMMYTTDAPEKLEFEVKKWPQGGVINFKSNVDVSFKGDVAVIAAEDIANLKSLTANGTKISSNQATVAMKSDFALYNGASFATTFTCEDDTLSVSVDPESFNNFKNMCSPKVLNLENWDTVSTVTAGENGFSFTCGAAIYNTPYNNVYLTSASKNMKFGHSGASKLNGKLTFILSSTEQTITVADGFPEGYYGLYTYLINGVIVNEGQKVPLDAIGNKQVKLRSDNTETVEVVHPFCTNTRLVLDELGSKGKVALFDEAYFGVKSNITVGENVRFDVFNGYFNGAGKIPVPIPKMNLINKFIVYPDADVRVSEFTVAADNTSTVHIQYSLSRLPVVIMNSTVGAGSRIKELILEYKDPGFSESDLIHSNRKYYELFESGIFCGTNIDCGSLNIKLVANNSAFAGEEPLVEAVCESVNDSNYKCVNLKVIKEEGIFWTVIAIFYITISLSILIGDALYLIFAHPLPYDDSVISATPLLTQKSTGIESTDK